MKHFENIKTLTIRNVYHRRYSITVCAVHVKSLKKHKEIYVYIIIHIS